MGRFIMGHRTPETHTLTKIASPTTDLTDSWLTVRIGANLYAVPISAVEEVLPAIPVDPVPACPDFVAGVVFVRGHVIVVLSAAERLGLIDHVRPDEPNIVCLRIGDRIVGVEFDEAIDLIRIGDDLRLSADEIGATGTFFIGVIDHDGQMVRLLDPDKLLSRPEADQLAQMPETR